MAGEVNSKRANEGLPAAQQTTVEKLHTLVGRRGSPKDVRELQRLIREAKEPASERGIFD